jgi:hypothetical protein
MILYNGFKWIFQQISTDFNWRSSGFPGHPNDTFFWSIHPPNETLVESFGSIHGNMDQYLGEFNEFRIRGMGHFSWKKMFFNVPLYYTPFSHSRIVIYGRWRV